MPDWDVVAFNLYLCLMGYVLGRLHAAKRRLDREIADEARQSARK